MFNNLIEIKTLANFFHRATVNRVWIQSETKINIHLIQELNQSKEVFQEAKGKKQRIWLNSCLRTYFPGRLSIKI